MKNSVQESRAYADKKHFKTISAVLVALVKNNQILLQQRKSTGFADGQWEFSAAGHVKEGETMREAALRELQEELDVVTDSAKFAGLIHSFGEDGITRYLGVFIVDKYSGEPHVNESDKSSGVKWFDLNNLPKNLIPSRITAINLIESDDFYQEYGWPTRQ